MTFCSPQGEKGRQSAENTVNECNSCYILRSTHVGVSISTPTYFQKHSEVADRTSSLTSSGQQDPFHQSKEAHASSWKRINNVLWDNRILSSFHIMWFNYYNISLKRKWYWYICPVKLILSNWLKQGIFKHKIKYSCHFRRITTRETQFNTKNCWYIQL